MTRANEGLTRNGKSAGQNIRNWQGALRSSAVGISHSIGLKISSLLSILEFTLLYTVLSAIKISGRWDYKTTMLRVRTTAKTRLAALAARHIQLQTKPRGWIRRYEALRSARRRAPYFASIFHIISNGFRIRPGSDPESLAIRS